MVADVKFRELEVDRTYGNRTQLWVLASSAHRPVPAVTHRPRLQSRFREMENGLRKTRGRTCFNAELPGHKTRRYGVHCVLLCLRDTHTPFQRTCVRCLQNGWGLPDLPDADV